MGRSAEISELISDVLNMSQVNVTVYFNSQLKGDLCIQIFWDGGVVAEQGSRVGISLAQAFKRFGLVDHSVWIRIE